jgi:integrase-like protein
MDGAAAVLPARRGAPPSFREGFLAELEGPLSPPRLGELQLCFQQCRPAARCRVKLPSDARLGRLQEAGRLAPILKRRAALGPSAFVFGSPTGEFQDTSRRPGNHSSWSPTVTIQNARGQACGSIARSSGRSICTGTILRHEGACRLLADGVDIRTIQLMLGHFDIKTTQRYLNITDEELRKALTGVWERRRQLKAVGE